MEILLDGVQALIAEPGRIAMILIGCVLMYLGIKKEYEPTLLVPMGLGTILDIHVKVGDTVAANQPVMVLEAMKMENEVVAEQAGTIASINVEKGAMVNPGDTLFTLA